MRRAQQCGRALLAGLLAVCGHAHGAEKGRLMLQEDFTTPAEYTKEFQPVAPGWRVRVWHGAWKRSAEGVESHWTSGHMPVLAYEGSFRNAIVELEFRFRKEEGKKAVCRISATNPELNPRAYSVSAWANSDSKERAIGVVLEHDEWKPGVITTVAHRHAAFEPGRWHTMRLEFAGNDATAAVDGVTVSGSHEKFGLPNTLIAIGTGHSIHELRRLRVYEALPGKRAALPGTVLERIRRMAALFDGSTLHGWIQAPPAPVALAREDVLDAALFARRLNAKADPVSALVWNRLDVAARQELAAAAADPAAMKQFPSAVLKAINAFLGALPQLHGPDRFRDVALRDKTAALLRGRPAAGATLARLNRCCSRTPFRGNFGRVPTRVGGEGRRAREHRRGPRGHLHEQGLLALPAGLPGPPDFGQPSARDSTPSGRSALCVMSYRLPGLPRARCWRESQC